ncbi:hypothetical protein PC128_g23270 [Phytophthora cactorum]|nr:hypothetical protein PC128_g23270 [Phytophthora cactorum]
MRALVLRDGLAVLVLVPVHEVPHDGLHQPVVKALDAQVEDQHITLVALLVQPYAMAAAVGSLTGEKLKETTPEADKKAVDDKVPETLQWLDANQAAEKEEFESGPPGSAEAQKYGGSIENRAQLIFEVVDVVLSSLPLSQVGIWLSPVSETFGCKDSAPRETYGFDLVYLSVVERRGSTQTTRASRRTAWRTTSAAFTMEC